MDKVVKFRLYHDGSVIDESLFQAYDNSQGYNNDYDLVVIPEQVATYIRAEGALDKEIEVGYLMECM